MPENAAAEGGFGRDAPDRSRDTDNDRGGAREDKESRAEKAESFDRAMDNASRPDRAPTTTAADDNDDKKNNKTEDRPDRTAASPGAATPSTPSPTDTAGKPEEEDRRDERGLFDRVTDALTAPPTDADGKARSTSPVADRFSNHTVNYSLDNVFGPSEPEGPGLRPDQSATLARSAAVMDGYAFGPAIPPGGPRVTEERGLTGYVADGGAFGAGVVVGVGERAVDLASELPNAAWEGVSMVNDTVGTVLDAAVGWTGTDLFEEHAQRNAARGRAMVDGVVGLPDQIAEGWDSFTSNIAAGNYYDAGRQMGSLTLDVAGVAVPTSKVSALGKVDDVVPNSSIVQRLEGDRATVHEPSAGHMFGNRPGHLPDTPENRDLLESTASDRDNYLGSDEYGNDWYAQTLDDGRQAWASVRNGEVRNGGLNDKPRNFDDTTGLSRPLRPSD